MKKSQLISRLVYLLFTISYCFLFILSTSCESERQKKAKQSKKVSVEDVEKGIRANIANRVKEGDGYFRYKNDSVDLRLKLVRVHTEYLSVLGQNEFFACVDLATTNGDVYDVDFFLKGEAGDMEITNTDVHKLNGKPFYTWKQAKDKTWYTVPVKGASNELLGVIEAEDRFVFNYEVRLPELKDSADIWIPVPSSDQFQEIEILAMEVPGKYEIKEDKTYGNKILYFKLLPEDNKQKIEISYKVKRIEKRPYEEDNMFSPDIFLSSTPLIPVGDRFSLIAEEAIKERQANTPLTKARALYDYIIDNMRYAKEGTYGTGDANYACDTKSGNCTEFHSFFISLARSAGIPARFAVGAAIPSERNEGGVNGYHCWAEFYAEGKWWPVDISEANKYTALATYYFGHHPANRIELSRGRDILPEPKPESGSFNFLAYPVLEVKGKRLPVKTIFTFQREQLLDT